MKSQVTDLLQLAESVYRDATALCSASVSSIRDLVTLRSRVKHEGISFLTITLADFSKDFERSLEIGQIDPTFFRNFSKNGAIPAFLQGMLGQLFDKETGRMFNYYEQDEQPVDAAKYCNGSNSGDEKRWCTCGLSYRKFRVPTSVEEEFEGPCRVCLDDARVVFAVRQICRFFSKIKVGCTPARESAALQSFVRIEQANKEFVLDEAAKAEFNTASYLIWAPVLSNLSLDSVRCSHGPGATFEGISGNRKFSWSTWPDRLEPYFPLIDSAYVFSAYDSEEVKKVTILASDWKPTVKVVPVPKTLRAPRIIAVEPIAFQFAQQGIRRELYRRIESHPLTAGHVCFTDQSVNQRLAMISSVSHRYATLDLSDASDRVLRSLALSMFDFHPDLRDAIQACTSDFAKLPDGTTIGPLQKFASMGNALCFPVEAMYFYTICVIARLRNLNLPLTYGNIRVVARDIYVYGDDIVVPTSEADSVRDHLHRYNCKVNDRKSFSLGSFRESCGVDAFKGTDVTPVYLRELPPSNRRQSKEIVSISETAKLLYKNLLWSSAELLYRRIENILGELPYVSDTSPLIGRTSFRGYRTLHRWKLGLQRWEVLGTQAVPVYRTDILTGYAALTKSLSVIGSTEPVDPRHLVRSARYGAVALQRRWAPAY